MRNIIVIALLSLVPMLAMSQPGPGRGERMQIVDELNLTDQQQKQIDQIRDEAMRQGIERRAEISKLRLDLRQLVRADKPDQSAIEKKMTEIASLRSSAESRRLNTWFSINKLLTPEQQKVWKDVLGRRMEMSGRMGMRGRTQGDRQGYMQGRGMQRFDRPMQRRNQ